MAAAMYLAILCLLLGKVDAAPLRIQLEPTVEFKEASWAGFLYFNVTDPPTENSVCESETMLFGEPQSKCGGQVTIDLSAQDELTISFAAPAGYEIEINGTERSRIEFQAKVPCGDSGFDAYLYQKVEGTTFVPDIVGSNASGLVYNAGSSFVEMGKCVGCGDCEVYTRVQYDGPINEARFSEISWTVSYNQTHTLSGPQSYRYGTETYCWIRGNTLPTEPQRRLDVGSFEGNEFRLVVAPPTPSPSPPSPSPPSPSPSSSQSPSPSPSSSSSTDGAVAVRGFCPLMVVLLAAAVPK